MKPGNNLVIQFSTAACELSKICIHKLLHCNTFTYAVERQDGLNLNGANVDTCYKMPKGPLNSKRGTHDIGKTSKNNDEQSVASRPTSSRKRHLSDRHFQSEKLHSIEKKFCETPTPITKVDITDPPIDIKKGQPKLPSTESIICETVNLNSHLDSLNTIHISDSPEKAKSINSLNETKPDHHFFHFPRGKHNHQNSFNRCSQKNSGNEHCLMQHGS